MSHTPDIESETIPVREQHRFETVRLAQMLGDTLGQKLVEVRQMRGGQSNPTFLLVTDTAELILRKQPPGPLLPSAHAVDREYRVLTALAQTDVPVPKTYLFSADRDVIGTPFYVMERLKGRIFWKPSLPEVAREERRGIYLGMMEALARLHLVDWQKVGLADFGKPGSYFTRQISRWTKQWEASRTRDNPCLDKLADWLPRNIPDGDEATVIHGDFRLDNMIFARDEPRVLGILDWELSTLGHPLADLAYNCIAFVATPDVYRGIAGLDLAALGIPTQDEYVAAYIARTGRRDGITPFHMAFSLFRLAAILEGILGRVKTGNAASTDATALGVRGIALAELGWAIVQ